MIEIKKLPCEIRGVKCCADSDGIQADFVFHATERQAIFRIKFTDADSVSAETEKFETAREVYRDSDMTATAYYMRGGLSGMTDRDIAFILLDGNAKVKLSGNGAETVPEASAIDFTLCAGKYVLEIPVYTHFIKLEFTESI